MKTLPDTAVTVINSCSINISNGAAGKLTFVTRFIVIVVSAAVMGVAKLPICPAMFCGPRASPWKPLVLSPRPPPVVPIASGEKSRTIVAVPVAVLIWSNWLPRPAVPSPLVTPYSTPPAALSNAKPVTLP